MCGKQKRSSKENLVLISNPYCGPHQIVPALDATSLNHAIELAKVFKELGVVTMKIGPELINTYGYKAVYRSLKPYVTFILADLKVRGTPDSLLRTLEALRRENCAVKFLTVMPDNGFRSIHNLVKEAGDETKIIIPIGLSSDLESESVAIHGRGLKKQNRYWLDEIALASGAHGVVCGKTALGLLKKHHENLLVFGVGIRPEGESQNDHSDTITPAEAIATYGAQLLIIGRPMITGFDFVKSRDKFQEILSNANSKRPKQR